MKAITALCFAFAFAQVVVGSKVRYSRRVVRQLPENADVGQLQQPPVATSSAISQDTSPSSISTNVAAAAQNPQPTQTILAPNALENNQLAVSSLAPAASQIPPNPTAATFTVPDFSAQIPLPNQSPSSTTPLTPFNPTATAHGIPANFMCSTPVQPPSQMYPYDPSMSLGRSAAYPPTPYANPMINPNMQQFSYNPYYPQQPMPYTNPQMMYGMSSPYPQSPMQYMPPYAQPPPMNYSPFPYTNSTNPRSSSPYPYPPNYAQAPSTAEDSATPTIMSSTGESGTDLNSLPPQVKEFMDMIPQILSMHESSPTQGHEVKRPPVRKLPKLPPSSLLKKKQYYQSHYPSSAYSDYPQRYGYYY